MDVRPVVVSVSLRICRFCLRCSTEELVNVCDDLELVCKVLTCLSLEVDRDDGLPGTICGGCLKLVEKLARFRDQCAKAELLLRASRHCRLPLLQGFERVEVEEERRRPAVGVDVGVQVEPVTCVAGDVDDVVLPEPSKQELEDDEGWHFADEADDEVLVDLTRDLYGEDGGEDSRPEDQRAVPVAQEDRNVIQESTVSNSEVLDDCGQSSSSSSDSSDSDTDSSDLDTVSFVSNNDDLRQQMEEMLLAGDSEVLQPLSDDDTRDLVTEFDDPKKSPAILTYDLTSSPEPEDDSSRSKTSQPTFPEAMSRLLSEFPEEPKSSSKHNWSLILNRSLSKPPQTPIPDTPASPDPETPASPDLDTVFANCEPISNDSSEEVLDIYDGCEPISDEDRPQLATPERKPIIIRPDPVTPEEIFDCELCDNFYPRQSLLDAHYKTYHKSPQQNRAAEGKMTIVIDNPTRKCPKCGEMVHKASFWAHKKSHGMMSERQLENYVRAEVTI